MSETLGTPERLRHRLRGDLDTIVGKALKKDPPARYASVPALADDLRRYLRLEPIEARPDTLAYRTAKFMRRNRAAVTLGTLVVTATAAGIAGTLIEAQRARAQRDFALAQLSRAEATNDFDNFLLSDAAPSGKPFRVNDLLARAEHILDRQQGQDAGRVELLISIGRQYWTQDEDDSSRRVLEKADRLSRGLAEPSVRAKVSCALASTLARGSELPRAEQLIQEGLKEIPDQPQFALDRLFCLMRGSEVSRAAGRSQEAVARAQAAMAALKGSPFESQLLDARLSMDLAESDREMGRYREAISMFEKASEQLALLGRDETQTAGTVFNNWALALEQIGRPLDAERIFRRAIDIGHDDRGEETVSPILLNNYARTLHNLDRLDIAADYAERAYSKALRANDEVVINQSLLERCRIYRKQGNLGRAAEMLSQVEPRLRKDLPPGHSAFSGIASEKSLLAQARGDLTEALSFASQAVALVESSMKAGGSGSYFLPTALTRRAEIEVLLHRDDAAVADAQRALEVVGRNQDPGFHSCVAGRAYLTLGRALHSRGESAKSRDMFRKASEHLRSALGPDHPEAVIARQLAEADSRP